MGSARWIGRTISPPNSRRYGEVAQSMATGHD